MTAPAENPRAGEKSPGGLAQLVRWLNEERPMTSADDGGFGAGAPLRVARWRYGERLATPSQPEAERDVLGEVRIGPAPRCAVAGETIALSVSLISARGGIYLGWPIKVEWTSSDPSIATVSEGGIVDVHAKGRVELTCTCEGKSGSVLLTVVEPAVAAAVGLPVPARLLPVPAPRPAIGARPSPERTTTAELPPPHRRSVERGSVRHGIIASLAPSRGTRQFLFRLAVGAATVAFVTIALSQSPEDYFVVGAEPPAPTAASTSSSRASAPARRQSARRANSRQPVAVQASPATRGASAPLRDTPMGAALTAGSRRTVAEAAGSTTISSSTVPRATSPATPPPGQPSAPAARTAGPAVSRVVVTSSPSQLTEGESVRLSAAGVNDRGDPVASRAVTWTSENGDVAAVDENGVVTARRPGTVTIVAAFEGRTGRVTLTVGARRVATAPPPAAETTRPAATPPRETGAAAVAQTLRARADEFVQALRERNGERVAAFYRAESAQDRKNLQALLERLRRAEARFKASDAQVGATLIGELEATADVQVPMSWTTPFGRVRNQTATFRAVLEPGDDGWRLVSIRAVGKIE